MEENNSHGGRREGSGRKPKETKQLSIKVPNDILNALNSKYITIKSRNIEIIKILKILSK